MTEESVAVREAVGVFHDETALQSAADELLTQGFDRSCLSLLASHHVIEEKLGHVYEKVSELEDEVKAPHLAYIGSDSRTEAKGVAVGRAVTGHFRSASGNTTSFSHERCRC